jgi:peptidoglycan/LPS O-acetylase OafA/YrhL
MLTNIYNRFRRITTNQLYFPEIDGIRFLAIALVILFHIHGYFMGKTTIKFADDPNNYTWINTFFENGDRGVTLFFVLSGFILCLPFAHHYINNGKKVSLKRYYLRRLTRLEPPYFIAMTAIFLLAVAMHVKPFPVLVHSWLASLVYSHNLIYHHPPLITVVAWSLEIEIQFYILAPLLFRLLMLPKLARRIILIAAPVIFILLQHMYTPPFNNIYNYIQYFLTGILLADIYVSGETVDLLNKPIMILAAFFTLIAILYLPVHSSLYAILLFPFLIGFLYYIVLKNDVVKKIFSYKFIPVIGGMCYSIYLLHYTIISVIGRDTLGIHLTSYYLPNIFL